MVLVVRERLRRCYDDTVTSMCAERVEVLHVAANDRVLHNIGKLTRQEVW